MAAEEPGLKLLLRLLQDFLKDRLTPDDFCQQYYEIFNFELVKEELSLEDLEVLRNLLTATSQYSEYEDELRTIPFYIDECSLREKVRRSLDLLT